MAKHQHQSQFVTESVNVKVSRYPAAVGKFCVRTYQYLISPLLGSHCRFSPRCSDYALGAYERFGFIKGTWLTLKRLIKCNPWHEGGLDPLPETGNNKVTIKEAVNRAIVKTKDTKQDTCGHSHTNSQVSNKSS